MSKYGDKIPPRLTFEGGFVPLEFWTNRIIPLVYDDSLSYYEVLARAMNNMNAYIELLEMVMSQTNEFTDILKTFFDDVDRDLQAIKDDFEQFKQDFEQNLQITLDNFKTESDEAIQQKLLEISLEFAQKIADYDIQISSLISTVDAKLVQVDLKLIDFQAQLDQFKQQIDNEVQFVIDELKADVEIWVTNEVGNLVSAEFEALKAEIQSEMLELKTDILDEVAETIADELDNVKLWGVPVTSRGVANTGITDVSSLISALSNQETALIFPRGSYLINNSIQINCPVYFQPGAMLTTASGASVLFNRLVNAEAFQIFHENLQIQMYNTPVILPEWFGASITMANNAPAIQRAITANRQGAYAQIPITGVFQVSQTISINYATTLIGRTALSGITTTSANTPIIQISSNGAKLDSLVLNRTVAPQTSNINTSANSVATGIFCNNFDCSIENVTVQNSIRGVGITGNRRVTIRNLELDFSTLNSQVGVIGIDDNRNTSRNTLSGLNVDGFRMVVPSTSVARYGYYMRPFTTGTEVTGSGDKFLNFTLQGFYQAGFHCAPNRFKPVNMTISNWNIEACNIGIYIEYPNSTDAGNTVSNIAIGMYSSSGADGIFMARSHRCAINNITLQLIDNGGSHLSMRNGIFLDSCTQCVITNVILTRRNIASAIREASFTLYYCERTIANNITGGALRMLGCPYAMITGCNFASGMTLNNNNGGSAIGGTMLGNTWTNTTTL